MRTLALIFLVVLVGGCCGIPRGGPMYNTSQWYSGRPAMVPYVPAPSGYQSYSVMQMQIIRRR